MSVDAKLFLFSSKYYIDFENPELSDTSGVIIKQDEKGKLKRIESYKNGKLEGTYLEFDRNSMLSKRATFKNGLVTEYQSFGNVLVIVASIRLIPYKFVWVKLSMTPFI